MASFAARRDALAAEIRRLLEDAAFEDAPIHQGQADSLIDQAQDLIAEMKGMASTAH